MLYPSLRAAVCSLRLLLDWSPNPNHIPLFQEQFFKREGIALDLVREEPADLAIRLAPQYLRSANQPPIIAVLVGQALQGFCVPQSSSCDLTGKTIGVKPEGTTASVAKHIWKNITFVNKRDFRFVDAIGGTFANVEPYAFKHPVRFIPWTSLGVPNYPELLIVGDVDRKTAMAFRRALSSSIAYCCEHPDLVFDKTVHPDQKQITLNAWARTQKVDLVPLKEWLRNLE